MEERSASECINLVKTKTDVKVPFLVLDVPLATNSPAIFVVCDTKWPTHNTAQMP